MNLLCLASSTCSCHIPNGTHFTRVYFTDLISMRTSQARLASEQGMAAEVEAIEALVVSAETAAGAAPINEDRANRGFAPLQVPPPLSPRAPFGPLAAICYLLSDLFGGSWIVGRRYVA